MTNKVDSRPREKWAKVEFRAPTKTKDYYISNHGRIKSISKFTGDEKLVKTGPDHRGFYRASIKLKDGFSAIFVHKEVAKAFCKRTSENQKYIIHKNLTREENRHTNLQWVTEKRWKKYVKDRAEKYGFKRSNKGGFFKLKEKQVAQIKKLLLKGKMNKQAIAEKFGVSSTQIKRIERGENWSNVEPAK